MTGRIIVLHSAWNVERALHRLTENIDKEDTRSGQSLSDIGATKEHVKEIVARLTRYGTLLVEGDMIATDHILSILRYLYDPKNIIVKNSWELGLDLPEVLKHSFFEKFVKSSNIVLLCGPLGNLITCLCLQKSNLSWLFDPKDDHSILTHPDPQKAKAFPVMYDRQNKLHYKRDRGVFLRCRHPFNSGKRMYAAMGTHAYGTQGAAALACSIMSAAEVISAQVDPEIKSLHIDYIAWVDVWKKAPKEAKEESTLERFSDPDLRYKIIHPLPPKGDWQTHRNLSLIIGTQSAVRSALFVAKGFVESLVGRKANMAFTIGATFGGALLIFAGILTKTLYYALMGLLLTIVCTLHINWLRKGER